MDQRLKDIHILAGSLNPDSFSASERLFLGKHMGKKSAPDFEDGPVQSVEFAMEWAADAEADEVKRVKALVVPSASPADAGKGGGKSTPARKTKKKTTKKKR